MVIAYNSKLFLTGADRHNEYNKNIFALIFYTKNVIQKVDDLLSNLNQVIKLKFAERDLLFSRAVNPLLHNVEKWPNIL